MFLICVFSPLQKSQSNGQPVTVAQEEVKVAEAVSKLPAQIKTEKVRSKLRKCETSGGQSRRSISLNCSVLLMFCKIVVLVVTYC